MNGISYNFSLVQFFETGGDLEPFADRVESRLAETGNVISKREEKTYQHQGALKRCPVHSHPGSYEYKTRVRIFSLSIERPSIDWADFPDFDDDEFKGEKRTPATLAIADLISSRVLDAGRSTPDISRVSVILEDFDLKPDYELLVGLFQRQLLGVICAIPGFLSSIGYYEWNTEFGDRALDGIDLWDHAHDNLGVVGSLHRSLVGPPVRGIFDRIRRYAETNAGPERIALMAKYGLEPLAEVGSSIAYYLPERLTVSELLGAWDPADAKPAR